MFESFFPKPRLFFSSFAIWSIVCVALWFSAGRDAGEALSLGGLFGHGFPQEPPADVNEIARAAFVEARESAGTFWLYQYMILCYAAFVLFWHWYAPHKWAKCRCSGRPRSSSSLGFKCSST